MKTSTHEQFDASVLQEGDLDLLEMISRSAKIPAPCGIGSYAVGKERMLQLRALVRRLKPLSDAASERKPIVPDTPVSEVRGQLYAPNGKMIVASMDLVPGNALIAEVTRRADGTLDIDWEGSTTMCWDGQYTEEQDGHRLFLDEDGHQWREDQLVVRAEEPKP